MAVGRTRRALTGTLMFLIARRIGLTREEDLSVRSFALWVVLSFLRRSIFGVRKNASQPVLESMRTGVSLLVSNADGGREDLAKEVSGCRIMNTALSSTARERPFTARSSRGSSKLLGRTAVRKLNVISRGLSSCKIPL